MFPSLTLWWFEMENTKIEKNSKKINPSDKTQANGRANELNGKVKNNSIAHNLTVRLGRFESQEKRLSDIIAKREKFIVRVQTALTKHKAKLEEIRKQHQIELDAIKALTQTVNGHDETKTVA